VAIRIEGHVNARDRDGKLTSEIKILADKITVITDKELREYQSTGQKPLVPKQGTVKVNRFAAAKSKLVAKSKDSDSPSTSSAPVAVAIKKLFVHIKNPDDHGALLALKQVCSNYPGVDSIVLVLGADKKSAIKLPFSVESSDLLVGELVKLLGEDAVVLK
jgi:hypothetical protein